MAYALATVKDTAYRGPMMWENDYYIHYHQENIGRAYKGGNTSASTITARWNKQKKQNWELTKQYYFSMFKTNNPTKFDDKDRDLLEEVFDGTNETLFTQMDNEIANIMQEAFDSNRIEKFLDLETNFFDNSKNSLQDVWKKGNDQSAIDTFDNLLETFSKCCDLLESDEGKALGVALLQAKGAKKQKGESLRRTFGNNLAKALSDFETDNNGKIINFNDEKLNAAISSLKALSRALRTGKNAKGENLTLRGLKSAIDHVFNTGFAEGIQSVVKEVVGLNLSKLETDLTGTDKYKFVVLDERGKPTIMNEGEYAGKADFKLKNLNLTLSSLANINGGHVNLDLGFSNKTYRSNGFSNLPLTGQDRTFGLGAGGKLTWALQLLFGSSIYDMYLAYNIMAHQGEREKNTRDLQDLILTRQLLSIASTRGGVPDFSSYIIANGTVVSIWQLISMAKDYIGYSSTAGGNQALTLSIPGRQQLNSDVKERKTPIRVRSVNKTMNSLNITAHLHLDKYLQALGK